MALSVNDILQMTVVSTYITETMLNVFHYRVDSFEANVDIGDIAAQMETLIIDFIANIQVTAVAYDRIIAQNLTNGIDIDEVTLSTVGTVSGDGLPSLVAASYRLNRSTAITRHGSKRFSGLPESQIAYNEVISAALSAYNTVADKLDNLLERTGTVDEDFSCTPVIVGRTLNVGTGKYELDLTKINPVQSATFVRISSQTTRRVGRGV